MHSDQYDIEWVAKLLTEHKEKRSHGTVHVHLKDGIPYRCVVEESIMPPRNKDANTKTKQIRLG